jgi:hypothetical protein
MNLTFEISFSRFDVIFFTFHKLLRYGIDGFPSPKEGVLRILTPLKIPRPRPGLNPQTLSPMTSTLTIISPRTTELLIDKVSSFNDTVVVDAKI